jgi:hypothetical protein
VQLSTRARVLVVLSSLSLEAAAQDRPWRVAMDGLVYTDTDNVQVYTPALSVRRYLDSEGSEVGARVAVDAVSAASVDVVSHASSRFSEARTQGQLDAAVAHEDQRFALAYRFSWEPDYLSNGVNGGWRTRLGTADSVLDLSYGITWDIVGRSGTSWSAFSAELFTHTAGVSFTQNLGPQTVLRGVYTLTAQQGWLEKPYRYVPLFDRAAVQAQMPTSANFDALRLPMRPPENVPDTRIGHAIGVRFLQYLQPLDGSIRVDYQFYVDDWLVTSHLVELMLRTSFTSSLVLGLYARGYLQTAAFFWQRTYVVDDPLSIPRWRSLDRDLSGYGSVTGGARVEWMPDELGGYLDVAAMFTHWDQFLLLDDRLALIAQLGVRWVPP